MHFQHNELLSMQAISHFKIASSFPVGREASFTQISEACGLNEPDLRRLLRHAMTKHIFSEPRKGFVCHTAASRLLAEDEQMLDWVSASTSELWQAASQTVTAMVKFPGSQEPNQTVFFAKAQYCVLLTDHIICTGICCCKPNGKINVRGNLAISGACKAFWKCHEHI